MDHSLDSPYSFNVVLLVWSEPLLSIKRCNRNPLCSTLIPPGTFSRVTVRSLLVESTELSEKREAISEKRSAKFLERSLHISFPRTLTILDALQISFVSTNTFSLVFSLLWTATRPPSKVFFVLYVVWFLCLIQPCTHKHFQFVKQITVLVVPQWKERSTIRFEKKAGVNAGFASRMVAHKEHEILKNPIYTVLIRVHL